MIEYINYSKLENNTTFMLVQATSPLTQTSNFSEALELYNTNTYDSILSCTRTYKFFWDNGKSLNYNYKNRPRRQDFNGILMKNGAFYINSVFNILSTNNRLSGKIGNYEMPEYTSFEIDNQDDWAILEQLMKIHIIK